EDGIRDFHVTGVQTCALPIYTLQFWQSSLAPESIRRTEADGRARNLDLLSFLHDRLKVHLRDVGRRHDLIDAVISPESDDLAAKIGRASCRERGSIPEEAGS